MVTLKDYNLSSNPFPWGAGVPLTDVSFFANKKEFREKIEGLVSETIDNKKSSVYIIFGRYGCGKTHTLRYMRHIITEKQQDAYAIYINNPGERFLDLYRSVINEIGKDRLLGYAKEFAGKVHLHYARDLVQRTDNGEITLEELPSFFNKETVRSETRRIMRIITRDEFPEFAHVLVHLPDKELEEDAWQFLSAQTRRWSRHLSTFEIGRFINDDETAISAFTALLRIMHEIGKKMIFLLIDEVEDLIPEEAGQIVLGTYTKNLRRLLDRNPEGLCMVLACSDDVKGKYSEYVHSAFKERTPASNILDLAVLENVEEVTQFIKDYLDTARITSTNNKPLEKQIHPFEVKTIEEIFNKANGLPREIVRLCSRLINLGISENLEKIGPEALSKC
jgi:Cdc6-like AAA superfamily ATPase